MLAKITDSKQPRQEQKTPNQYSSWFQRGRYRQVDIKPEPKKTHLSVSEKETRRETRRHGFKETKRDTQRHGQTELHGKRGRTRRGFLVENPAAKSIPQTLNAHWRMHFNRILSTGEPSPSTQCRRSGLRWLNASQTFPRPLSGMLQPFVPGTYCMAMTASIQLQQQVLDNSNVWLESRELWVTGKMRD